MGYFAIRLCNRDDFSLAISKKLLVFALTTSGFYRSY
jgi:hypothetical protein